VLSPSGCSPFGDPRGKISRPFPRVSPGAVSTTRYVGKEFPTRSSCRSLDPDFQRRRRYARQGRSGRMPRSATTAPPRSQSPLAPNLAVSASPAAGVHQSPPLRHAPSSLEDGAHPVPPSIAFPVSGGRRSPSPKIISACYLLATKRTQGWAMETCGSSVRIKIPLGDFLPWIFLTLQPNKA
jgi:hypothetical protein